MLMDCFLPCMMRVVVCVMIVVSLFVLVSCAAEKRERPSVGCKAEGEPLVVALFFVDACEGRVMLGPVRVVGADCDNSFCTLAAPFSSWLHSYASLRPGVADKRVVRMYAATRGFSIAHPACWRFIMLTGRSPGNDRLSVEVNYSYSFDDASGCGYVEGMERLSLCGFDDEREIVFSNDTLPFSVICVIVPYCRYFNAYYM